MSLKRAAYLVANWILRLVLLVLPFNWLRVLLLRAAGMRIGPRTHIARGLRVDFPWRVSIGSNCWFSAGVYLDARGGTIRIGNTVDLSSETVVYTLTHSIYDEAFSPKKGDVVIADRVWIGTRAIVLPGTTVSEGCVVGALSVIRCTTDRFSLYVGNLATKLKTLPESRASAVQRP